MSQEFLQFLGGGEPKIFERGDIAKGMSMNFFFYWHLKKNIFFQKVGWLKCELYFEKGINLYVIQ